MIPIFQFIVRLLIVVVSPKKSLYPLQHTGIFSSYYKIEDVFTSTLSTSSVYKSVFKFVRFWKYKKSHIRNLFKKTWILTWDDRTPNCSSWFSRKIYIQANSHSETIIKIEDIFAGNLVRNPCMSWFLNLFTFGNTYMYLSQVLSSFAFRNTGAAV